MTTVSNVGGGASAQPVSNDATTGRTPVTGGAEFGAAGNAGAPGGVTSQPVSVPPQLDPPKVPIAVPNEDLLVALLKDATPDMLAAIATELRTKSMNNQLDQAVTDIQANRGKQDQLNADRLQKIQDAIKKEAEAKPGFWGKLFGWLGKIASLAASVAGVIAGAAMMAVPGVGTVAGALLIGVSLSAAGGALTSIVNEFLPADKQIKFPISLGGLAGLIASAFTDEETAKKVAMWVDIGITILTAVVMIVPQAFKALGSIMKGIGTKLANLGKGASKAVAESATQATSTAANAGAAAVKETSKAILAKSRMVTAISGGAGGLSSIGAGVIAMSNADIMKQSRELQAQAKEILAALTRLQNFAAMESDRVQEMVDAIQTAWTEGAKVVTQAIQNMGEVAGMAAAPVRA